MAADHTTRWLIRRDVEAALELGAMVPWDEGDMLEHNKLRNGIAMVCENSDQQIVGWLAYTVAMPHVSIANIACDDWTAPATALVQRLLNKMGHRRDLITVSVPDYYDLPISSELVEIGGEVCRRSTGFPCMLPEGF